MRSDCAVAHAPARGYLCTAGGLDHEHAARTGGDVNPTSPSIPAAEALAPGPALAALKGEAILTTTALARPRVVIVGAGFGGLYAAKALRKAAVDVMVIDRRNHHLFQPLLYQVATA